MLFRSPTTPHLLREPIFPDVEVGVIGAVHDDVASVGQVKPAGRDKVHCPNAWNGVYPDDPVFRRHGVHHHTVEPVLEWVVYTGAAVEVHVQYLRHKSVFVLGLDNVVSTLGKVGAGVLRRSLECGIDLTVVRVCLPAAHRLILENQEKPARQRLAAALLSNKADRTLAKSAAGGDLLLFQISLQTSDIFVRVRPAGNRFELQPHWRYFQPAGKGGNDTPLLLIGAKEEVNRLNFQYFDVAAITGFNDAVFDFL